MKKILAFILSIGMLFSLSACGGGKNSEQTDVEVKTENSKISKEEYEKMTADDLFDAVVKSPDKVTLDEYVAIVETYQYVDIAGTVMELEKNITGEVLDKIGGEYAGDKRPLSTEWVPLLITHKSPQVRAKAFRSAYPVYKDNPEFVKAAKKAIKAEKEPHVIFFILQGLPETLIENDSEIAAFVQEMTTHKNERIQNMAKLKLEDTGNSKQ